MFLHSFLMKMIAFGIYFMNLSLCIRAILVYTKVFILQVKMLSPAFLTLVDWIISNNARDNCFMIVSRGACHQSNMSLSKLQVLNVKQVKRKSNKLTFLLQIRAGQTCSMKRFFKTSPTTNSYIPKWENILRHSFKKKSLEFRIVKWSICQCSGNISILF